MSILIETAPERIYLLVSDEEGDYDKPFPETYPEDDGITWSDNDQLVACTVAYIRYDLLVDTYADEVEALRPVLPPFGAANGKSWSEAVREQARDLAAARALLRDLRDGDHVFGNDSEPLLIRIDAALAGRDAP